MILFDKIDSTFLTHNLGHRAKQFLAFLMCFLIGFQPLMLQAAELTAAQNVPSANQPSVGTAGNGVPLVNIVRPNASGLSHNKYNQFNVGQQGTILNNSNQSLQRSQLGGLVQGNPNLRGTAPASVILNEVISSNRSLLEGTLEVHGGRADIVVANPNGITCNGCGFINTPRVTLSTGRPQLDTNGALSNLLVEEGDINIGLNGANLDSVNAFELVSRKISIGGPIKVLGDLNLVAGRNSYAYKTGLITPLSSDGNEPGVAIDSSLLGGMYAGRIKIVSTDRGAGVNTQGQMAANAHGMTMTADGKLVLGKIRAKKTIKTTSKSKSIQVQRTLFSDEAIILEGKSAVTLDDGALVVSAGDVSFKSEQVTLGKFALVATGTSVDGTQSNVGNLTVDADQLNAGKGQLAAGGILTVNASTINLDRTVDDNSDVLRSLRGIILNSDNVSAKNARIAALGSVDVKSASSISLTGGLYSASENILVEAENITTNANLNSKGLITLRSTNGSVVNSGQVAGDGGIVVGATTILKNEGDLFSVKAVNITSFGASTNTASGRVVGNGGVTFNVASFSNAGKVAAQGSRLTINTAGNLDNTGELMGFSSSLNVDGTLSNSGKVDVTNALTIKGNSNSHSAVLNNSAGGSIISGSGSYSIASLNNGAELMSRTTALDVNVTGNLINSGTIAAKTTGTIELNGNFTNSGSIISEQALVISGRSGGRFGTLSNSQSTALINGAESLTIRAANVTNAGEIGSVDGSLLTELSNDLTNNGVFYSGTTSSYKLDGNFTNTNADVLAETNLTITGLSDTRANSVKNASGNIEAILGDLTLAAASITNQRTNLTFSSTSSSQSSSSGSTTTTVVTTREILGQSSAASKMLAGSNITIDTNTLNNNYSQIAANGDITISANTVTNTGRDLIETIDTTAVTQHSKKSCTFKIFGKCLRTKTTYWTTSSNNTSSSVYDAKFASIEAGGTLNANVSGYLNNNAVRGSVAQIGISSGTRALNSNNVTGGSGPGNLVSLNELNVSISALLGRSALFDVALEPNSPFLIETRSKFIDPSEFLGSDFFLNQVGGYNPDQNLRRFGDAYIETRLILDQIFELTGQRYVGDVSNSRVLLQALYENALDTQGALGLTVGVGLTPNQVARLRKDITWLEERVVRGQRVLVPRVYLASSTLNNAKIASARIAGTDISVFAKEFKNSGKVQSSESTIIDADRITSTSGDIIAGQGKLVLASLRDIELENTSLNANMIDIIAGQDFTARGVDLQSQSDTSIFASGNVLITSNETITDFANGSTKISSVDNHTSSIYTGGDLSIKSMANVTLAGVSGTIDGSADITAVSNLTFDTVGNERSASYGNHKNGSSQYSYSSIATALSVGEDLTATSTNGTLTMVGTLVEAGGEISATGREVVLAAAQNIETNHSVETQKGFLSSKQYTTSTTSIVHQGVLLAANDNLTVTATGGDLKTVGTDFVSGEGDIALNAADNVLVGAFTDVHTSKTSKKKSALFGLIKSSKQTTTRQEYSTGSDVLAAADLSIASGANTDLIGASLNAGNSLRITTGGDLNISTSEDKFSSETKEKSRGFFASSSGGSFSVGYKKEKHQYETDSTTNNSSTLSANDIVLTAGNDFNSQATIFNTLEDLTIEAANDINLVPAYDLYSHDEEHDVKSIALSVSVFENVSGPLKTLADTPRMFTSGRGNAGFKAISAASSVLRAVDALGDLQTVAGGGTIAGVKIGIGFSSEESENSEQAAVGLNNALNVGGDLILSAGQDIKSSGSQIAVEGNATLEAGHDILLSSTANLSSVDGSNSSFSVGLSSTIGLGTNGLNASTGAELAASQGEYDRMERYFENTNLTVGGALDATAGQDLVLEGAVVEAASADLTIGGDLRVASSIDTVDGSNSSRGFNASISYNFANGSIGGGVGVNGAEGSESKGWVSGNTASGIITDETLNIDVAGGTEIIGAVIASRSGDLTLATETLTVTDLDLHDDNRQLSGSLGLNVGIDDEGVAKPGAVVEGQYANREVEGVARGTIGEGDVTVRSQTEEETQTQLANINRDVDKAVEVTGITDEGFELYASDTSVKAAAEVIKKLANEINDLLNSGRVSKKEAEILRRISSCAGRQGFNNYWNPFNWIVSSAYAEADCSDVTVQDLSSKLSEATLRELVAVCKDPDTAAMARVLLAAKLFSSLPHSKQRLLSNVSMLSTNSLKELNAQDIEVLTTLAPIFADNISASAINSAYNIFGVGTELLKTATFFNRTPPAKSPSGLFDTTGLSWNDYLAVAGAEEAVALAGGHLGGKALASVTTRFGSAVANQVTKFFAKAKNKGSKLILPSSGGAGANITISSRIKNSPYAVRLAQKLNPQAQKDVNSLVSQLKSGNANPGIGTRSLGNDFFELRGRNAGRVIVKQKSAGDFDIVGKFQGHAKGDTANSAVIKKLMSDYGN